MTKYATLTHSFNDPWADDTEVSISFSFAKPTTAQIKRFQDTVGKNSAQASRNLVTSTVSEEDQEKLNTAIEEYPGILATFSEALLRSVGVGQLGK